MRSRVGSLGGAILLGIVAASSCRDSDAGNGEGTGGRIEPGPAWQSDGRLPTAFVAVPYRFELTLPGFDQKMARWRVSAGSLPDGLTLSESGIVAGVPQREGEARFTLRAEAEEEVVVRPVRMVVSRKRWVAYRSDEQALGQHLLYLADLSGSGPRVHLVTSRIHPRSEVLPDHYRFAPADEALAYLVDATRDGVRELYAVDLSGGRMGRPVRLDQGGHVHSFAWAPDARSIAYVSERDGQMRAYVVPWPFEGARFDLGRAGGRGRISWVHPDLLIIEITPTTSAVARRRLRDHFEVTSRLPRVGQVIQASGERVVLGEDFYLCAGARHLMDLGQEPFSSSSGQEQGALEVGTPVRYAPGLARSALVEGNTLRILSEDRELDRVSLGSCDAVSWSRDGSWLVSVDEHRRLRVSELRGNQVVHHRVDGDYDAVVDWPPPELDESGRWIKFHDARGLHLARLLEGRPERAVPIHDRVTLPGAVIRDSAFVPGGVLFVARAGSRAELVRLDLAGTDPESRILAIFEEGNGPVPLGLVGALADGSWLGLLVQNGDERFAGRPVSLWVASLQGSGAARAELLAPNLECAPKAGSTKVSRSSGSEPIGAAVAAGQCETVRDVVFQP